MTRQLAGGGHHRRRSREGFPHAPPESYLSEEGWLCVGDEAWTPEDWPLSFWYKQGKGWYKGKPKPPAEQPGASGPP